MSCDQSLVISGTFRKFMPLSIAFFMGLIIAPGTGRAQSINNGGLSPSTWTVGGGGFQLTVNGAGYPTNAQVLWNGTALTPVSSSATKLVVLVSSMQTAVAATVTIAVHDPTKASTAGEPQVTYPSTASSTPEGVDLEIGIGSRVGGQRVQNYQVSGSALSLTNFGNQTPQFLVGISLPFCLSSTSASDDGQLCGGKSVWGSSINRAAAFVSVQFASGSSETISGYTIGLSEHVSKYLHVMVGYSLSPIQEISPGFAAANPGITSFDGVKVGSYPGNVTTAHYRGGLFIGIALPLSLKSLLSGSIATN